MSAQAKPQPNPRAEGYRQLAMEAVNNIAAFKARAEEYERKGEREIADEYNHLAAEATTRAQRYMILADFVERTDYPSK